MLFDDYLNTTKLPKISTLRDNREHLVNAPTPLHKLDKFRTALGGGPQLWIKRDDLSGLALGGNKARKLEYLLAQARAAGADTLVTVGAAQSNHARQTAAAAAQAGLDSVLVLRIPDGATAEYQHSGNVLLDNIFGAELVFAVETPEDAHPERALATATVERLQQEGRTPLLLPSGGSTPIGALGYVEAYAELASAAQLLGHGFNEIVLASGSGGTQAGLIAGKELFPQLGTPRIHGVSVAPGTEEFRQEVDILSTQTLALFNLEQAAPAIVNDRFVGAGYGKPSPEGVEAIKLFAHTEGILLDPVYTAKAAAALISGVRAGAYSDSDNVLFLHTGGAPALFAYPTELASI